MKRSKPVRIAHRGASKQRVENTLESFQAALRDGFDALEIDVRTCATGEIVVFHDETLARLNEGDPRSISETSLSDLRAVRIQGEPIAILSDILPKLEATTIFIELKDIASAENIIDALIQYPDHSYVIISKKIEALKTLAKIDPNSRFDRGYISNHKVLFPKQICKKLDLTYFVAHHWTISWWMVCSAQKASVRVIAYPISSRVLDRILRRHELYGVMYDSNI